MLGSNSFEFISMYGMRKDKLALLPHDPSWRDKFHDERHKVQEALAGSTVTIEHIGSTAIPTIHAKPILDIAILCDEKGIDPVIQALIAVGYEYRGPYGDQDGHYYAVLDQGVIRFCQVHLYSEATSDYHAKILFRDVLRKHPDLAREYNTSKLELASVATDKLEYAELKSSWVDNFFVQIINAAKNY